jgi:hypothetical protein
MHVAKGDNRLVPSAILATSDAQMKQGDVTAVPLVALGATGTQVELKKISAVPPVINEAMLVNHGTRSAVLLYADRSQEVDKDVISSEMSVADMGSRLKANTALRGAIGIHEDEEEPESR